MSTQPLRKTDDPEWRRWRARLGGLKGRAEDKRRRQYLASILGAARSIPEDDREDSERGKRNRRYATEIREEIFAGIYISLHCNGTRAATIAGYSSGPSATIAAQRLLKRPRVQAIIRAHREALCLDSLQTLHGISEVANADWEDFLDPFGNVDLAKARSRGKLHLMKRYTITEEHNGDGTLRKVKRDIELHDSLAAKALMARHHALLLDVHAVKRLPATAQELTRELLAELQRTGQMETFRQALLTAPIDTTATEVQDQSNEG